MKPMGWFVAGVLVVLLGIEELRLQRLRQQIAGSDGAPPPATAAADPAAAGTGEPATLVPRRERPEPTRSTEPAKPEGEATQVGKTLRKMAENPVSQAMMNQGVKAMASIWYADLIKEFDLTQEEADYFLALKANLLASQQQFGMKMLGAKTEEERKVLKEEIQTAKNEHREAVKTFLNHDEDFARYEAYEKRLPERQQMDGLRASMSQAGAPLRAEQEAELIDAMYRARTTADKHTDWNGSEGMDAIANGQAKERFEREWELNSQRAMREAAGVLDETQLEAFRAYQEQLKEMQLMGLEMAEKMFKPDDK